MGYESVPMDDDETLEEALAHHFALGEVVESRHFMGAYYFACSDKNGAIGAVVVLTLDGHDGTRRFKTISESAGPMACCCPLGILSLLSDTADETAKAWRERCLIWNEAVVELFVRENLKAADELAVRINKDLF